VSELDIRKRKVFTCEKCMLGKFLFCDGLCCTNRLMWDSLYESSMIA
jgi:hypothetical protein